MHHGMTTIEFVITVQVSWTSGVIIAWRCGYSLLWSHCWGVGYAQRRVTRNLHCNFILLHPVCLQISVTLSLSKLQSSSSYKANAVYAWGTKARLARWRKNRVLRHESQTHPADFLWQAKINQWKVEKHNYLKKGLISNLFKEGNCQGCRMVQNKRQLSKLEKYV